jgi:hypothetical protein
MRTSLWAERRVRGGGGAGAHLSGPLLPHFRDGMARRDRIIARALWRPRVHLQSTTRPTRTARADQHDSWSRTRHLTMHCECAFPPTQLDLTRGVSGPTSPGGDARGAFPRGACQGGRWRPRVHTGVPVATEPPAARAPFCVRIRFSSSFKKTARKDRKLDVRSSRRSSATLPRRRWSRTSRRRTSTPRPSTFCCASRCGAADAPPCPLWAAARSPGALRRREYSSTPDAP